LGQPDGAQASRSDTGMIANAQKAAVQSVFIGIGPLLLSRIDQDKLGPVHGCPQGRSDLL
jgi:hypothetical protein